jgi:serine/threonine protein kinase
VRKVYQTEGSGSQFENEVLTLMKVTHKNIVRFIGYCSYTKTELVEFNGDYVSAEVSERLICMEYMPLGSLHSISVVRWITQHALVLILSLSFLFSFLLPFYVLRLVTIGSIIH